MAGTYASMNERARQVQNTGSSLLSSANNSGRSPSALELLMAQMTMAKQVDPKTMAGVALGRLLRQAFDSWKDNYDARGEIKDKLLGMTPEERAKYLEDVRQRDPRHAAALEKYLNTPRFQQAIEDSGVIQTPTQAPPEDLPTVSNSVSNAVRSALIPNYKDENRLLGFGSASWGR